MNMTYNNWVFPLMGTNYNNWTFPFNPYGQFI